MRVTLFMWLLLLGMFQFAYSDTFYAVAPTVTPAPTTTPPAIIRQDPPKTQRAIINEIVLKNAEKYGVSANTLHAVISCESGYKTTAIGDHGNSYGLVQIYLRFHPEVSKEEAFDPEFAIAFLAKNIAAGRGYWWTCYPK